MDATNNSVMLLRSFGNVTALPADYPKGWNLLVL